MVVLFHGGYLLETAGIVVPGTVGHNLLRTGYLGVQFFFVLSGFILAYTYLPQRGTGFQRTFWVARFARIYPVYVLGLLLVVPFVANSYLQGRNGTDTLVRDGILQPL